MSTPTYTLPPTPAPNPRARRRDRTLIAVGGVVLAAELLWAGAAWQSRIDDEAADAHYRSDGLRTSAVANVSNLLATTSGQNLIATWADVRWNDDGTATVTVYTYTPALPEPQPQTPGEWRVELTASGDVTDMAKMSDPTPDGTP